jgi:putative membrane protein insertion efficiency factor
VSENRAAERVEAEVASTPDEGAAGDEPGAGEGRGEEAERGEQTTGTTTTPASTAPKRRGQGVLWLVASLLAFGLAWDLAQPPTDQVTTRALLGGIDFYQAVLSPVGERMGVSCRFEPTCSHYGEAVIARDGAVVGVGRAAFRILRCGPWTPRGTVDPP